MGKRWDYEVPAAVAWALCLAALRPGAHLLSFASTRTQHRMCVNIEDAGFEIRDMIAWVYGSGFPKSLDVGKAIDREAGAEREVLGPKTTPDGKPYTDRRPQNKDSDGWDRPWKNDSEAWQLQQMLTAPATPAAQAWDGWGTALKPALEPITVARKPFDATVAENVLEHGTGALNVDGCRVGNGDDRTAGGMSGDKEGGVYHDGFHRERRERPTLGRWPANLVHDGSEEATAGFPDGQSRRGAPRASAAPGNGWGMTATGAEYDDQGTAARFFYCAKASRSDRFEGNDHPTVKPVTLMRYLVRLVTPPGGTVLDQYMGSGTTLVAAKEEGFAAIGIERNERDCEIAANRLRQEVLFDS
jgi:site-specific DNA-methyltransferase (adenine-specific)